MKKFKSTLTNQLKILSISKSELIKYITINTTFLDCKIPLYTTIPLTHWIFVKRKLLESHASILHRHELRWTKEEDYYRQVSVAYKAR